MFGRVPDISNIERGGSIQRVLLTLVIPTRNEADNVARLVGELDESLSGVDYRVVFVDASTDETPEVIRSICEEDGRVVLIHREGSERDGGLSTAVTTGLDAVSKESVYTCVMDADLQHPPGKVREMLEEAQASEADVVVASRYVAGGDYSGLSGTVRWGVSVGSKYLAQVVFKEARKTSDPMTGFFLLRNEAISDIQFRPLGFKVLLEILVCAPELQVIETPLNVQTRNAGVSKASIKQGLEYLVHIASLFWYVPSAGRFWKFAMVGASGVLVNMLVLIVLAEYLNTSKVVAWVFAVGVSILSNFLLNNAFTWRDVRHSSRIYFLLRGALAYPVAIIGIGANFAVYYPLLKYVSDAFPYYVFFNFLGILAATSVNFVLSARFVFRMWALRGPRTWASFKEVAEEVCEELRAEWVGIARSGDLAIVAQSSPKHSLNAVDEGGIRFALHALQPALFVTGPRRLPQARTNARWTNSLAVPLLDASLQAAGVLYATRSSTEPFTEEDLHWLTAYATGVAPLCFAAAGSREKLGQAGDI